MSIMRKHIYADNAATTQLDKKAFEAMKPYLLEEYGNASQPYSFSRAPKMAIKEARIKIAKAIGASPEEIYFTSGGTESDNWALKCISKGLRDQIITSSIEHHAILNACEDLEKHKRASIVYLPVSENGAVSPEELSKKISSKTKLVSVMYGNNEIGTIQPIKELCDIAHKKGAYFHTDAVQAIGHVPVDVDKLGIDMLSSSAHKFNGPKGIGFIYIKKGTKITPFNNGGAQENGMRAGTENVASIVGMAEALENNIRDLHRNTKRVKALEERLLEGLHNSNIEFKRNGENQLPGIISLSFKGADGEALLHRLDLMGICVSTGSACDSKNTQISHVLKAIHLPEEWAKGTIRISLGKNNTENEVDEIVSALRKIVG